MTTPFAMIRCWKQLAIVVAMASAGCVSATGIKGHLTSGEVESLMTQGVVKKFEASVGGSYIVLDNGDVFRVELPATPLIDAYVERRRKLGQTATFEIE
jgi:hypothetical protein